VKTDVRSGGTAVRGATNCIDTSHFYAEICVKDNCYQIMRDNYLALDVPVYACICSRTVVALKNYSKLCSTILYK
jgi:hypothetical protein